mgnify:CR=1 FL=1
MNQTQTPRCPKCTLGATMRKVSPPSSLMAAYECESCGHDMIIEEGLLGKPSSNESGELEIVTPQIPQVEGIYTNTNPITTHVGKFLQFIREPTDLPNDMTVHLVSTIKTKKTTTGNPTQDSGQIGWIEEYHPGPERLKVGIEFFIENSPKKLTYGSVSSINYNHVSELDKYMRDIRNRYKKKN